MPDYQQSVDQHRVRRAAGISRIAVPQKTGIEEHSMSYYFAKPTSYSFDEAITRVTEELKKEGFGVLTEIDVKETLKKKLNVDFRRYKILGACNPPFAHQALQAEEYIGTMLPCNVIVQEKNNGVEIAAVDPVASMAGVKNDKLAVIAEQVRQRLNKVIQNV
jgi:uncharacterized protein (DUF302 family)